MTSKNYSLDKNPGRNSLKNISMKRINSNQFDKGNIGNILKSNINEKMLIKALNDNKQTPETKIKNDTIENFQVLQTDANVPFQKANKNLFLKRGISRLN